MSVDNQVALLMSFFVSAIHGLTIGGLLCLLNIPIGILFGSLVLFLSFYGLINLTWDRDPEPMNRRFNDNY